MPLPPLLQSSPLPPSPPPPGQPLPRFPCVPRAALPPPALTPSSHAGFLPRPFVPPIWLHQPSLPPFPGLPLSPSSHPEQSWSEATPFPRHPTTFPWLRGPQTVGRLHLQAVGMAVLFCGGSGSPCGGWGLLPCLFYPGKLRGGQLCSLWKLFVGLGGGGRRGLRLTRPGEVCGWPAACPWREPTGVTTGLKGPSEMLHGWLDPRPRLGLQPPPPLTRLLGVPLHLLPSHRGSLPLFHPSLCSAGL